jgi:hypothetical protein
MAGKSRSAAGKLWNKLGRGYYALMAVGTFLYLEATAVIRSVAGAETVQGFLAGELATFAVEALLNSFLATFWPFVWVRSVGVGAGLAWALGGYLFWAFLLAIILSRREKALKREIGL